MVIRPLRLQRNEGIIEGNCVSLPDLIMRFMQTLNELGSKEGEGKGREERWSHDFSDD